MATLYISYFGTVDKGVAGDPLGSVTVTTSGTSAQSAAIPANAIVASVTSDAAHYVAIGSNPTAAAANGFYLPANGERAIRITTRPADNKFAAITA